VDLFLFTYFSREREKDFTASAERVISRFLRKNFGHFGSDCRERKIREKKLDRERERKREVGARERVRERVVERGRCSEIVLGKVCGVGRERAGVGW